MSKHTRGPWTIQPVVNTRLGGLIPVHGYDNGSVTVALVPDFVPQIARLIAAAPELLAALERILSYDDMVEGADEARAAINAARGED
jgi:hypothetical protein